MATVSSLRTLLAGFALVAAALVAGSPASLAAQDDVTLLGRRYGTVPPPAYYQMLRENPRAFRFSRGWIDRNPRLALEGTGPEPTVRPTESLAPPVARSGAGPAGVLGSRDGQVSGTFAFPVLLGLFAGEESAAAYTRAQVQAHFFDGPNPRGGTVEDFFAEASRGAVQMEGEAQRWVASPLTRTQVVGSTSGLGGDAQVGPFIITLLDGLDDGSIDWGRFDNDGPDGIPNSGDDDGFVDVVAVIHPTAGAECGGSSRVWSHRWSLWAATGRPYTTSSPAAGGGFIQVSDYTIQPLLGCGGEEINDIGVLTHELGHGFGLPDLYCTGSCSAAGIGEWGLMGSGAWGCRGNDPAQPCQMSAWSRSVLGWVSPEQLPGDAEPGAVVLEPVQSSGRVLRYDIPGTREYFLLENRQPLGFDQDLHAAGLLIWHVDKEVTDTAWARNAVNADPGRYGVRLVQADGIGDLEAASGGRGDAGDPFPGSAGRTEFHAGSNPGSFSHDGAASGLTLTGLAPAGSDLSFHLLTRFQNVALSATGTSGSTSVLEVNGAALPPGETVLQAAPEQRLVLGAAAGEALAPGVRLPFTGWGDGVPDPDRYVRIGARDTAFVATYAGEEVQVAMALEGERFGVIPGNVTSDPSSPGLWFPRGTAVTLEAVPTAGFAFQGWTGALNGGPNPVGLVVDDPVSAGAVFSFEFQVPIRDSAEVAAGDQLALTLLAENSSAPVTWSLEAGELPPGTQLLSAGLVVGAPLATGRFEVTLRARDALGLEGTGTLVLAVGEPRLPLTTLAGSLLLNGESASPSQAEYLDLAGNRNGFLDVGDVRSHLRRIGDAPSVEAAQGKVQRTLEPVLIPNREVR